MVAPSDLPVEERVFQARWAVRDGRVPKDILVVTPAEYEKYSRWLSGVVREAADYGVVLHEAA